MIPGLAIDYTRSMKVNTAVELLVQESFQLCSAMQSSVILLLLLSKTGCRGTARFHPAGGSAGIERLDNSVYDKLGQALVFNTKIRY